MNLGGVGREEGVERRKGNAGVDDGRREGGMGQAAPLLTVAWGDFERDYLRISRSWSRAAWRGRSCGG